MSSEYKRWDYCVSSTRMSVRLSLQKKSKKTIEKTIQDSNSNRNTFITAKWQTDSHRKNKRENFVIHFLMYTVASPGSGSSVAYFFVHSFAVDMNCAWSVLYSWAIAGTSVRSSSVFGAERRP